MSTTSRLAVVAGTFDPITNGHRDMIARATRLFDRVIVAVLVNPAKQPLFTTEERVGFIRDTIAPWPGVAVETFDGLLADFVRQRGAAAVVRGLRNANEFADETSVALMNRHLNADCETVFLVPAADVVHISSRLVREIASLGGPVEGLVPPIVEDALRRRFPADASRS